MVRLRLGRTSDWIREVSVRCYVLRPMRLMVLALDITTDMCAIARGWTWTLWRVCSSPLCAMPEPLGAFSDVEPDYAIWRGRLLPSLHASVSLQMGAEVWDTPASTRRLLEARGWKPLIPVNLYRE